MRPLKYSPQVVSAPMSNAPFEATTDPLAAVVAASAPFTYRRTFEPSYVTARCVHVDSASGAVAAAVALPAVVTYPSGTPEAASSPNGRPPPVRSLASTVCQPLLPVW